MVAKLMQMSDKRCSQYMKFDRGFDPTEFFTRHCHGKVNARSKIMSLLTINPTGSFWEITSMSDN